MEQRYAAACGTEAGGTPGANDVVACVPVAAPWCLDGATSCELPAGTVQRKVVTGTGRELFSLMNYLRKEDHPLLEIHDGCSRKGSLSLLRKIFISHSLEINQHLKSLNFMMVSKFWKTGLPLESVTSSYDG